MTIKSELPHLGDALMALAMLQHANNSGYLPLQINEPVVWAGLPATNALFLHTSVQTTPVEHITQWDVDLSNLRYASWDDFAKALNIKWAGKPAKLIVTSEELHLHKLPDTGKCKAGVCYVSRDKHRSYPHSKYLVKLLKKHFDVHVFGLRQLPVRQLVAEVSQMDLMVSVDTGLAHIAGCLDVPLIIIEGPTDCKKIYGCYQDTRYVFTDSDKCQYKPCVTRGCKHKDCLYLIHPSQIVNVAICDLENIAVCRMKGLGDVIMMIPALYGIKDAFPQKTLNVITSPGGAYLLKDIGCIDNIIESDYEHVAKNELIALPPEATKFNTAINFINAVDFEPIVYKRSRPDNFAYVASSPLGVEIVIDDNFVIDDFVVDERLKKKYRRDTTCMAA